MDTFEFNEDDVIGQKTLEVISEADTFSRWMYDTIAPFCKGKVLEIGSGIGNISTFFIEDGFEILCTDLRKGYCDTLEKRFKNVPHFLGTEQINITDPDFDTKYAQYFGSFNTVFALNVVEHIKEDDVALNNCYKLLAKDGNCIILVPSYQRLYNGFDKGLGHYRRYTKKTLSAVFNTTLFTQIHKQYFNFIGIFGWYVSGSILKKKTIPQGQMRLYNALVPIFKVIDSLILNSAGLSTIVVGTKSNN